MPDRATLPTNEVMIAAELYLLGRYGEAKTILTDALKEASRADALVSVTNNLALVIGEEGNYHEALRLYLEISPLVDLCENDFNKGNFHFGLARTCRQVATGEKLPSFFDRVFIEYEAARHYFQKCGRTERIWRIENNLAFLFLQLNQLDKALEHVAKARTVLVQHGAIPARFAEVDDTEALIHLAEGNGEAAFIASSNAVQKMRDSEELKLKASILETHLKATEAYMREVSAACQETEQRAV